MDYKFSIINQTGSPITVNACDEDKADWTNQKDPETVILHAEISTSHIFPLSGKAFASDPWFKMEVKNSAGETIATLYTKFDGNTLHEIVINSDYDYVDSNHVIVRDYSNKEDYSYSIARK